MNIEEMPGSYICGKLPKDQSLDQLLDEYTDWTEVRCTVAHNDPVRSKAVKLRAAIEFEIKARYRDGT